MEFFSLKRVSILDKVTRIFNSQTEQVVLHETHSFDQGISTPVVVVQSKITLPRQTTEELMQEMTIRVKEYQSQFSYRQPKLIDPSKLIRVGNHFRLDDSLRRSIVECSKQNDQVANNG